MLGAGVSGPSVGLGVFGTGVIGLMKLSVGAGVLSPASADLCVATGCDLFECRDEGTAVPEEAVFLFRSDPVLVPFPRLVPLAVPTNEPPKVSYHVISVLRGGGTNHYQRS